MFTLRQITSHPSARRLVSLAVQAAMFVLAGVGAFLLRFDFPLPAPIYRELATAMITWVVVKTTVFYLAKLDRGLWRYVTAADLIRVTIGNCAGSGISSIIIYAIEARFPRSIFAMDFFLCLLATGGIRFATRVATDRLTGGANQGPAAKRTLIYGAGDAGVILLREINNNPKLAYQVCGFLDDGISKKGMRLAGVPVLGTGINAVHLVKKHRIGIILIAIPSASGPQMTRILEHCYAAGVECKTVPGLGDIIEERGLAGQIRDVAVEDLLGRTPIHLETGSIRETIENKVVLVTGAAGSIGSELCRQIAVFRPAAIVGYEIAESPLFEIDREMRARFPHIPFYPEIGSIQNRDRFEEVLRHYRPTAVYHAAAYKHVPLMETHVFEAIENNVFGTYNVAMASAENGVEDFLLISSDKAVRPTNVMGATKRLAELILLELQNGRTKYVAVRFGNVLGSNGSVVPIFKKQIASGGPVTVTDPEMRRYFMTIPEACQLVLQALAIGEGGQICVLDMGKPIKIVDLARNLILLSGLTPNKDIRIEFTGKRPGEKLYEELSLLVEETVPSLHEKIRIFVGSGMPDWDLEAWLDDLHHICAERDLGRLVIALKETVLDYSPSIDLLKRMVHSQDIETNQFVNR